MSTWEERAASSDHPTLLKVLASATFTSSLRSTRSRVCHFTSRRWIFQSCAHYSWLTDDGCQNQSANCYSSILLILFGRSSWSSNGIPHLKINEEPCRNGNIFELQDYVSGEMKMGWYCFLWLIRYRSFFFFSPICVISDNGSIHKAISLYILLLFDSITKWTFNYNNKS